MFLMNTDQLFSTGVPQFGFFWYLLMIKLRMCVFGRNLNEVLVLLSVVWEACDVDMSHYH